MNAAARVVRFLLGIAGVFAAEVPSPGTYHPYLDFRHDVVVRTAQFQLDAGGP